MREFQSKVDWNRGENTLPDDSPSSGSEDPETPWIQPACVRVKKSKEKRRKKREQASGTVLAWVLKKEGRHRPWKLTSPTVNSLYYFLPSVPGFSSTLLQLIFPSSLPFHDGEVKRVAESLTSLGSECECWPHPWAALASVLCACWESMKATVYTLVPTSFQLLAPWYLALGLPSSTILLCRQTVCSLLQCLDSAYLWLFWCWLQLVTDYPWRSQDCAWVSSAIMLGRKHFHCFESLAQ